MRHQQAVWTVLAAACLAAPPPPKTARRPPVRHELKVTPSDAIEVRVQAEIAKADAVLDRMDAVSVFESPYFVSAVFYRDGFLSDYPSDKPDGDPARRIIAHLSRCMTPEKKRAYIALLHELYDETNPPPRPAFTLPVPYRVPSRPPRSRRTHRNALDIFTPEGTPVRSASAGVVLLAENGWNETDPFSTSSHAGGNTAIVFDPATDRFYRYCHMEKSDPIPGKVVEPGTVLGTVGHSGLNASRPRHGGHLHFEVNRWMGDEIRPLTAREVWELLRAAE